MKIVLSLLTTMLLCVGMSMAQATQPQSSTGNDQATTTQTTTQTQTPAANQDQNATSQNGAAADQNATADQNANATSKKGHGKLPQTASPLPLLGLLGMGSLGLGAAARRKRK